MGPILHVLTDLGPAAALREALSRLGWDNQVAMLREARGLDPRPWLELRRQVRDVKPAIIHAWGLRTLRAATIMELSWRTLPVRAGVFGACTRALTGRVRQDSSIIVACELPQLGRIDRWLIRRAGAVVATIPSAVAEPPAVDRAKMLHEFDLPPDARLIACSGRIERGHGFMEAAWVFDILKYVYPSLWLLILGDGLQRRRVEEFARSLGREDVRVRFAGSRPDAASLLGLAEVVWVLGERGGTRPALEALAAGRPVVGRARPDLADALGEGAGILVPKADRHEVARATRRILDDAALAEPMRSAARERAVEFAPERVALRFAELYARLARGA